MMRLALFFCTLGIAASAEISEDIKARLSPFEILRGDFQQTKSIRIIKKPLKSSGHFVMLHGKGVLWTTLKPFPATMKVTPGEITQIKEGKTAFSLKSEQQPALRLVGKVLFAVFSADVTELKKHFEISGSLSGKLWKATLIPKEAWVAKVAKEIRLEGGKTVESLQIDESNGDKTSIRFLRPSLTTSLSASEKALFE